MNQRQTQRVAIVAIMFAGIAAWSSAYAFDPNPALQDLAPNSWLKLSTNPEIPGDIRAWSTMVYDDVRHQLLMFGGGHVDYWGNEVYRFDFGDMTWHKMYEPNPCSDYRADNYDPNRPGYLVNTGYPMSRHTYQMTFVSHLGEMFVHSGAYLFDKGCMVENNDPKSCGDDTWLYDPAQVEWEYKSPTTNSPGGMCSNSAEYDPVTQKVWVNTRSSMLAYTPETNSWSDPIPMPAGSAGDYDYMMTYNSGSGSIDFVDGKVWRFYPSRSSNHWESKTPPQQISLRTSGLEYDPVTGQLLVYQNVSEGVGVLRAYNWDSNQWSTLEPSGTKPEPQNQVFYFFCYDPVDNVFITVIEGPSGALETWAYKHTSGVSDSTPPSTPGNPAASAQDATEILVSWSASTDPESGVSHYRVYSSDMYVGQTGGTSFVHSGLQEATTYSYEISAVNFAGLESPRSVSVSATTEPDTTAPRISSVSSTDEPTGVIVSFDEPVEQASATEISNYQIDNGIQVLSASREADLQTVTLQTTAHTEGVVYTITINGVQDLAASPNTIAADSQATYSYVSELIVSIVSVASGEPYEVAQNLTNGSMAYIDRSFGYGSVPQSLVGATHIKTANNDKLSQDASFLTLSVNRGVTVYVAHDNRYQMKPDWLQQYEDSGEDLTIDTAFSLFRKDFPQGTITLGGNVNPSEAEGNSMYTVILVPSVIAPPTEPPDPPQGLRVE